VHAFFEVAVPAVNSNTTFGAVQIQSRRWKGRLWKEEKMHIIFGRNMCSEDFYTVSHPRRP